VFLYPFLSYFPPLTGKNARVAANRHPGNSRNTEDRVVGGDAEKLDTLLDELKIISQSIFI
jgi:hypothetical protein